MDIAANAKANRIAIYMPSFAGGGAERIAVRLASNFASRGMAVLMIVDSDAGPNAANLSGSVTVRELKGKGHFRQTLSLRRLIRDFKPDALFTRLGLCPPKAIAASIGTCGIRRVTISYHNPYEPQERLGGRLTYIFASLLTRLSKSTLCVSADVRRELVQRFGGSARRTFVVHNPVDVQWIQARAEAGAPAHAGPFILSVGRLVAQKDFATLIRSFALVSPSIPHDLVICGEGPLRSELLALCAELGVKNRVALIGYLENPFPTFAKSSLFVMSSIYEGFGNVILEALALGVRVVSTNCPGGPSEILDGGRYGGLVAVGDPTAMASEILRQLNSRHDVHHLTGRASQFSTAAIGNSYLRLGGVVLP